MPTELLIGGYTESLPHAEGRAPGVMASRFDDGEISPPMLAAQIRNPSWLAATAAGDAVYAVEENDGGEEGGIVAMHRDRQTGRLDILQRVPSGGTAPAHLAIDPSERLLAVANYGSGTVAVHELLSDHSIGEPIEVVLHEGSGQDAERQEAPHPHQVVFDSVGGVLAVPDLGIDSVIFYRLEAGRAVERDSLALLPGTGPRHIVFHPGGRHLFVIGELSGAVDVFVRDGPVGRFRHAQRISILHDEHDVPAGAEILLSADGTTVFAGNRSDDPAIAVLRFDSERSRLTLSSRVSAPRTPRAMTLVEDDRFLLVAGQDSHEIVAYAFEPEVHTLKRHSSRDCPSPTAVLAL
ncbi:lactonase family protein [Humibacter soli]